MVEKKFIDLSHDISINTPNYPDDPPFSLKIIATHNKNGYQTTLLKIPSHFSTHIDFPIHFFKDSLACTDFDINYFFGNSLIIKIDEIENEEIDIKDISENFLNSLKNYDYIIFNTGWSKYWGTEKYFHKNPYLSMPLAELLVNIKNLKGIGIDSPSVDKCNSKNYRIHKILLKNNKLIIENLCNLEKIDSVNFYLCCFPLKIKNGDGSPARIVAILK